MARQRLMVGTYGEISCFRLKSGSWQARARYCDVDGVVRQYRKNGETKNKARANLKAFFVEHTGTFGDGALAPDDTVQDLLDLWFKKMEQADGGPARRLWGTTAPTSAGSSTATRRSTRSALTNSGTFDR